MWNTNERRVPGAILLAALLLKLTALPAAGDPTRASAVSRPPARLCWAHLVPWFSVKVYDVNRRDFALGMGLDQWPGLSVPLQEDRVVQCRLAAQAGIDGFAVDLPSHWSTAHWTHVMGTFFAAAEGLSKAGPPFLVAPCLDGHSALGPVAVAKRIEALLAAYGSSPSWLRLDGRWVVWTYDGGTFSPQQWRKVTAILDTGKHPILLVLDLNGWLSRRVTLESGELPPPAARRLEAWARLPAMFYCFRGQSVGTPKWQAVRRLLRSLDPNRAGPWASVDIGTLWPGYWSLKSNYRAEPPGFSWLKRTEEASRDADWLCAVTWNDYAEDTHFEPSLAYGNGRLALLREFIAAWRRGPASFSPASLRVWQPCAVHAGQDFRGEVGAWFPAAAPSAPMEAHACLLGADGADLADPVRVTLSTETGPGLIFGEFRFRAAVLPATSWVRVRVMFRLGRRVFTTTGPPTPVWPCAYDPVLPRRGVLVGIDGPENSMQPPGDVHLGLDIEAVPGRDGSMIDAVRAAWPPGKSAGGPLYLFQNLRLLCFQPGTDTKAVERRFSERIDNGRQPWQVFRAVPEKERWGFFGAFGVTPAGRRTASELLWVPPPPGLRPDCAGVWEFDAGHGDAAEDSGPYGSTGNLKGNPPPQWVAPGRNSPACLRFDGKQSYVALPPGRTPSGSFTVRAWFRNESARDGKHGAGTRCIYTDTGGLIFALDKDNRLYIQMKSAGAGKWAVARSHSAVEVGRWTHGTATYDGRELRIFLDGRLEGATAAPAAGFQSLTTAVGCNPFGRKAAFFRGLIDSVRLDARVIPPSKTPEP